jgi:hypothetical protein
MSYECPVCARGRANSDYYSSVIIILLLLLLAFGSSIASPG